MCRRDVFRVLVLSVVKHDYIARGIAAHPRFELAAVADQDGAPEWIHDRNETFAREFGIPYIRDIGTAVRDYNVQVAVVSPEAERHCELSIQAAEMGLHVVQDKPMSDRLTECDRLVESVRRHNVRFLMWNRNFLPAIQQTREIMANGGLGELESIHVDFYFAKDAGPSAGTRRPDEPPLDWLEHLKAAHATGADGGVGTKPMGELANEACYPLAIIDALLGARAMRVFARAASHFHQLHADNDVEDLSTVTLEFDGGKLGSLTIGRIGRHAHPNLGEIKLHLIGTNGALVIDEPRPEVALYYRGQPAGAFRHRRLREDENASFLAENLANAIDTASTTCLDVEASRRIAATVFAAHESARTGEPTNVPR